MRRIALALLAACGSHSAASDAAGCPCDAPGDAPPPPGLVTVQVVDHKGAPLAGEPVVFIDADTTTTAKTTDATGAATQLVSAGASVTVVHVIIEPTPPNITTLTTVTQLVPGDSITLDADAFLTHSTPLDTTPAGTFTVSYPGYAGAASYSIYDPCGVTASSTTTKLLALAAGCATSPMNLVVVATSSGGTALAWTQKAGVTFASGGSTTITDSWHALGQITASYTNPTAGVANIELDRYTPTMRGARAFQSADTNGATTAIAISAPLATGAVMQAILDPCRSGDPLCNNATRQIVSQAVDGTQTTYALDVSAQLLPWLGNPVFAPATTTLSIAITGSQPVDVFAVDMLYVRNNTDPYLWRLFAPAPLPSLQFPTLPAGVTDATIKPTDKMSTTHAYACESDAIAGYRAAIADPYGALDTCISSPDPTTKPFGGTLNRFSQSN
jgi:hypothetical protein